MSDPVLLRPLFDAGRDIAIAEVRDGFDSGRFEADLARLAREGSRSHRLAIAERDALSPTVAQALCDSHDALVIRHLLANEGAALPEELLHGILDTLGNVPGIVDAMARRRLLPVTVAGRLAQESARGYVAA